MRYIRAAPQEGTVLLTRPSPELPKRSTARRKCLLVTSNEHVVPICLCHQFMNGFLPTPDAFRRVAKVRRPEWDAVRSHPFRRFT